MVRNDTTLWDSLEEWSGGLFLFASVMLLATAAYRGAAYLIADVNFNLTIGNIVLLGRLAVLLALAGFTVQLAQRNPRLGKLSRVVVALAILSTTVLIILAVLAGLDITTPVIAIAGLATVSLSVITYLLFGVSILRTGAYPQLVGGLLVTAALALVVVFFGMMMLPVNLIGTVVEGVLFAIYLVIGLHLRSSAPPALQSERPGDTTS